MIAIHHSHLQRIEGSNRKQLTILLK